LSRLEDLSWRPGVVWVPVSTSLASGLLGFRAFGAFGAFGALGALDGLLGLFFSPEEGDSCSGTEPTPEVKLMSPRGHQHLLPSREQLNMNSTP